MRLWIPQLGLLGSEARSVAQPYIRKYLLQGMTANAILGKLRNVHGCGYRRATFLLDIARLRPRVDKEGKYGHLPDENPIPVDAYVQGTFKYPDRYRYTVKIRGRDRKTGRFTSLYRQYTADAPMTPSMLKRAVWTGDTQLLRGQDSPKTFEAELSEIHEVEVWLAEENLEGW